MKSTFTGDTPTLPVLGVLCICWSSLRDRGDREGRHRDKDRDRHRSRRNRSESREPGSDRRDRDRDRRKGGRRRSGDDRGSGDEGDNLPKEGSSEAWKEASPTRGESKGGDNDSNQTPERKGGDTKYFVAGSHKSPKEPPPAVMRDAGDRALMASRESVRSRRGESGGGPGQGLDGMEEGSSEVMHKSSIDDMV